ncbi:hypothetical protein KUF71_025654, partial [Frankliniella fusca]
EALVDDQLDEDFLDEGKRAPSMYQFGLGKRARAYEFGLGKRSRAYEFGLGKRARAYEFGLGKRRAYEFGLGKRRAYEFGLGKRARAYEFGLGKRARAYEFGLGKRSGDRKLYSFGLGKRLPNERRYAFGLGKRSDELLEPTEQVTEQDAWQAGAADSVGKREVAPQELKEVAAEHQEHHEHQEHDAAGDHGGSRTKRAASMQYSFGLGKRLADALQDGVLDDADVLELEDMADANALERSGRGSRQYGFGLGKRAYDVTSAKRGPNRQYGFGLGRRSMQYNFGIGKRSSGEAGADATLSPAER